MKFLDCFVDEMNTSISITGEGVITGVSPDGTPAHSVVTKYSDYGAMWLLSSSEKYECSKLGYPATHNIVLYPEKELIEIVAGDTATISGEQYVIYPGENPFKLNDILIFKIGLKND